MKDGGWLLALLVGTAGCHRAPHRVERVEVIGSTVADNPLLGMTPAQVQSLWMERLRRQPLLQLLPSGAPVGSEPSVRISLELGFTREEQRQDRPGTYAEVGATLTLKRKTGEETHRYEVSGVGESKLKGDSPVLRQAALRVALEHALDEVTSGARIQLDALDKSKRELVADLSAKDARTRLIALYALAGRKAPEAVPGLIARLGENDSDEVRRAMGALVEIGDVHAVPALIDLMRGKEPGFSRELLFALSALGGGEAQAYLYTVAQGHEQQPLRQAAEQALQELTQRTENTTLAPDGSPKSPDRSVGNP